MGILNLNIIVILPLTIIVILWLQLRIRKKQQNLYVDILYKDSAKTIFDKINDIPFYGKYDHAIIRRYFNYYFNKIKGDLYNTSSDRAIIDPVTELGLIFKAPDHLLFKIKQGTVLEMELKTLFYQTFDQKDLAKVYFFYLVKKATNSGIHDSTEINTAAKSVIDTVWRGIRNGVLVTDFLVPLEDDIKQFLLDGYDEESKVMMKSELAEIRSRLGDCRPDEQRLSLS